MIVGRIAVTVTTYEPVWPWAYECHQNQHVDTYPPLLGLHECDAKMSCAAGNGTGGHQLAFCSNTPRAHPTMI